MWTRGHLLQTDPGHQSSPAITTSACMCTHTRARTHTYTHTNSCWHEELTAPGRGWLMLVNHWGLDPPHMVLRYIHIRAKVGVLAVVHSFPLYLWLSRSLAICLVPDTSVIHGLALMMTTSMLMYSGVLFSDKKKWGLKLQKSRDESQIHIAKGMKPVWKGYVMVPIIWNSGKGKNRDSEKIRGYQGSRGGEEDIMGGTQGVFREVNPICKTLQWRTHGTMHLSRPTELYS